MTSPNRPTPQCFQSHGSPQPKAKHDLCTSALGRPTVTALHFLSSTSHFCTSLNKHKTWNKSSRPSASSSLIKDFPLRPCWRGCSWRCMRVNCKRQSNLWTLTFRAQHTLQTRQRQKVWRSKLQNKAKMTTAKVQVMRLSLSPNLKVPSLSLPFQLLSNRLLIDHFWIGKQLAKTCLNKIISYP